jgi:hypothetical protein
MYFSVSRIGLVGGKSSCGSWYSGPSVPFQDKHRDFLHTWGKPSSPPSSFPCKLIGFSWHTIFPLRKLCQPPGGHHAGLLDGSCSRLMDGFHKNPILTVAISEIFFSWLALLSPHCIPVAWGHGWTGTSSWLPRQFVWPSKSAYKDTSIKSPRPSSMINQGKFFQ